MSDIMARKVKVTGGDFLSEVDSEGYHVVEVAEISDYEPTEDTKSYGDAVFIHYTVYNDEGEDIGQIRELVSLRMSPLSKLYNRYAMLTATEPQMDEEVDVDSLVGTMAEALLINEESKKGDPFVKVEKMRVYDEDAETEEETEGEEEPEEEESDSEPFDCGACDKLVEDGDATVCPHCGATFEEEEEEEDDSESEEEEETEEEEDAPTCFICDGEKARRKMVERDDIYLHNEHGLRCLDVYEKEQKMKKKANQKKKTPPKKKVSPKKKTAPKPGKTKPKKKVTKKKR